MGEGNEEREEVGRYNEGKREREGEGGGRGEGGREQVEKEGRRYGEESTQVEGKGRKGGRDEVKAREREANVMQSIRGIGYLRQHHATYSFPEMAEDLSV